MGSGSHRTGGAVPELELLRVANGKAGGTCLVLFDYLHQNSTAQTNPWEDTPERVEAVTSQGFGDASF